MKNNILYTHTSEDFFQILRIYLFSDIIIVPLLFILVAIDPSPNNNFNIFDFKTYSFSVFNNLPVKWMLVSAILLKCFINIVILLEKIEESLQFNKSYRWFIKYILVVSITIVLSFSVDYYIVYKIADTSWEFEPNIEKIDFFEFFYYSFMTFSTIGYGELKAISTIAKVITMLESIMSLAVFVFILSGFDGLKSSFRKDNPLPTKNIESSTDENQKGDLV